MAQYNIILQRSKLCGLGEGLQTCFWIAISFKCLGACYREYLLYILKRKKFWYAAVKIFLRVRLLDIVAQMVGLLLYRVTILYCDIAAERPKYWSQKRLRDDQ